MLTHGIAIMGFLYGLHLCYLMVDSLAVRPSMLCSPELQLTPTHRFELTAAGLTIDFWTNGSINIGVWITVFLVAMFIVQAFGVRAYGWTEVMA